MEISWKERSSLSKWALTTIFVTLAVCGIAAAATEEPKPAQAPVKIGLIPFKDATGGESAAAAQGVVKWLPAEMVRDKRLLPKVLSLPAEESGPLDRNRAVAQKLPKSVSNPATKTPQK